MLALTLLSVGSIEYIVLSPTASTGLLFVSGNDWVTRSWLIIETYRSSVCVCEHSQYQHKFSYIFLFLFEGERWGGGSWLLGCTDKIWPLLCEGKTRVLNTVCNTVFSCWFFLMINLRDWTLSVENICVLFHRSIWKKKVGWVEKRWGWSETYSMNRASCTWRWLRWSTSRATSATALSKTAWFNTKLFFFRTVLGMCYVFGDTWNKTVVSSDRTL